jgi:DNA primase small subunit
VRELTSPSRREIVDYVTGKVETDGFVREAAVAERGPGRAMKSMRIPSADEGGWRGRLTRATVEQFKAIADDPTEDEDKAKAFSKETGLALREAKLIVEALSGSKDAVEKRIKAVSEGRADFYQGVGAASYRRLFAYHLGRLRGWCDEPVSSDIKRLIRAPGSLHGKTGLRAIPLTRNKLDDFDPLVDAAVLDDEPISINVSKPIKVEIGGKTFDLKPGVQKLPRFAAVFTILRRSALLEGDTPPPPPPKAETKAPPAKAA